MIGVVVWSSETREKAVIWCEDHAALAYLQGWENLVRGGRWPSPGDLVELEGELVGNLRHARRVSMMTEQGCSQLPDLLRASAAPVQAPAEQPRLRLVATNNLPATAEIKTADVTQIDLAPAIRAGAAC